MIVDKLAKKIEDWDKSQRLGKGISLKSLLIHNDEAIFHKGNVLEEK